MQSRDKRQKQGHPKRITYAPGSWKISKPKNCHIIEEKYAIFNAETKKLEIFHVLSQKLLELQGIHIPDLISRIPGDPFYKKQKVYPGDPLFAEAMRRIYFPLELETRGYVIKEL